MGTSGGWLRPDHQVYDELCLETEDEGSSMFCYQQYDNILCLKPSNKSGDDISDVLLIHPTVFGQNIRL